jgi:tRNA modification GTPase
LALPFAEGHSYTGEQSVELSMHGSTESVRSAVDACLEAGARMSEPGEFTLRAFLNGRIDLTQAEAVRDTVDALTQAQLRSANLQRKGILHKAVSDIRQSIAGVLAEVEVSVDFSEEVGDLDRQKTTQSIEKQIARLTGLLAHANVGRILRQGIRIAIVGPPNAGKSSLLNALLGQERAIVTDIPGTTRDYVEEIANLDGVPCVLVDTAGLRETNDPIETIGVERSRSQAGSADWIWYVFDGSLGWRSSDETALLAFSQPVLKVANKSDLVDTEGPGFSVSALTGMGIPELISEVKRRFGDYDQAPLINERHRPLIEEARKSLEHAIECIKSDIPLDLASTDLSQTLSYLGEVTGESIEADILDRIFHEFCIGK